MRKRDFSKASQNCNNNIAEQQGFSMMNFLMVATLLMIWPQIEKDVFGTMERLRRSLGDGKRSGWTQKRTTILCSYWGKKINNLDSWGLHTTIGSFLRTTGISHRAILLSNSVTNSSCELSCTFGNPHATQAEGML